MRTGESTAKSSRVNEGVALDGIQPTSARRSAIRLDGALDIDIFSCLFGQNDFNSLNVSSVTPINVDNLTLQLCNHPDREQVNYILNGFSNGFRLGFHPESVNLNPAKANCPSALQHPSNILPKKSR